MFTKIYRAICKAEVAIASTLLCTSVVVIFIAAIMRSVRHPINWGNEIALLLFAWATFLGADVAYRNNATVFVDIILNAVPKKVRRAMRLFSHILVSLFLAMLVYYGVVLCIKSVARPFQGIDWLSYSWVTASLPFSCFMMLITSLRKIYYEYILKTEVPVLENPDMKPMGGGPTE